MFYIEIPADRIGELAEARVNHNGISRLFTYYIPCIYNQGKQLPLMITLHGRSFNAKQHLKDSKFDKIAEKEGFILLAPNCVTIDKDNKLASEGYTIHDLEGIESNNIRWNVNFPLHNEMKIDDVGYINSMLDYFVKQFTVDKSRVYVSGMSNGALMTMYLVTKLQDKIAGAAPVCGIVPYDFMKEDLRSRIKIVVINNDNDPTVSINGYPDFAPPVRDAVGWFNQQFGITGEAIVTQLPRTVEDDPTNIKKYEWADKGGSQIVYYVIEGGGHTWPGGTQYYPEERIGKLSRHYNASDWIWEELKDFRKY